MWQLSKFVGYGRPASSKSVSPRGEARHYGSERGVVERVFPITGGGGVQSTSGWSVPRERDFFARRRKAVFGLAAKWQLVARLCIHARDVDGGLPKVLLAVGVEIGIVKPIPASGV